jgi:hypothetical protein
VKKKPFVSSAELAHLRVEFRDLFTSALNQYSRPTRNVMCYKLGTGQGGRHV